MNRYSTLGVERLIQKGVKPSLRKALGHALWKFIQFYIIKAGFLDGRAGLILAIGHFDYTFFRYIKLLERE